MDAETPIVSAEAINNLDPSSSNENHESGVSTIEEGTNGVGESTRMDESTVIESGEREMGVENSSSENPPNEGLEGAMREEDRLNSLLEARAALQQPDAILEDDVISNIKVFFEAGGSPNEIINSLSGSYRGFPQMVNLVSFWLRRAGAPESEVVSLVEGHIRDEILTSFEPQKADRIFAMGRAPHWLSDMIAHVHWRHLVYKLSESHRDCLLLNYGIQQISEAGHDDEIASLPSASTYFSVFNRVLKNTIQKALKQKEWDLDRALADFAKMSCHSEHTFVYTQSVLRAVADSDPSGRLTRISQGLSAQNTSLSTASSLSSNHMEVDHDENSENLEKERQLFYTTSLNFLTNISSFPTISTAILSVMKSSNPSPGDIRRIHLAYTHPSPTDPSLGPPPAAFLQSAPFLDRIIASLFNTQHEVPSDFLNSYFWILSFASSSTDTRSIHPHTDSSTYASTPFTTEPIVAELTEALHQVVTACQRTVVGMTMHSTSGTLFRHLQHPIISIVVLHWIRTCLCDAEKVPSAWGARFLQAQIGLLQEIAAIHPLHHSMCLQLIIDCFSVESAIDPTTDSAAKKKFIEYLVFLMEHGFVLPVLRSLEQLSPSLDKALVRHFIVTTLDMAAPPFSSSFLDHISRLLPQVKIEASEHRTIILQFIQHVLKPGEYQLSTTTKDALSRVQRTLSTQV